MNKKQFKELAHFQVFTSRGKRVNGIYFDYKRGDNCNGFKYAVYADTKNASKQELFNILYNWALNEEQPPYFVKYVYAETDEKRFKLPLSISGV